MNVSFQERFSDLLQRHVHRLTICWPRVTGLCPFHQERNPSFSANVENGVWHCFGCGASGGVKRFAELVGEPWASNRSESRAVKARRARFHAEQQARVILERRAEERNKQLCVVHREVHAEVVDLAGLLSLFHHRPDLAEQFPDLVVQTERQYGDALFRLSVLGAKLDGEIVA